MIPVPVNTGKKTPGDVLNRGKKLHAERVRYGRTWFIYSLGKGPDESLRPVPDPTSVTHQYYTCVPHVRDLGTVARRLADIIADTRSSESKRTLSALSRVKIRLGDDNSLSMFDR